MTTMTVLLCEKGFLKGKQEADVEFISHTLPMQRGRLDKADDNV